MSDETVSSELDVMRSDLRASLGVEQFFFVCWHCLDEAPDHRGPGGSIAYMGDGWKCRSCHRYCGRMLNFGRWRDVVGWSVMAAALALAGRIGPETGAQK